ncbi:MAG: UDP-N-acetylmuramate--L-alanine ligase [Bacteroidota bacterium]
MKIHFIAIGGAVMHNLAIALHLKGYEVTGSDDEIFEPSAGRLAAHGLLPPAPGWDPGKITPALDAVILGMHARADNPELLRAQELGVKIYSFPEYLYEQSKDKTRVVIGGSHGKTTLTSMIMHILRSAGADFDYMVGAQIEGFDTMVRVTAAAPVMILEGDEYLTSPLDPTPKFHWYRPHIALLTGIAWDHINVFPTFEQYVEQFRIFLQKVETGGRLYYFGGDEQLERLAKEAGSRVECSPYREHPYLTEDRTWLLREGGRQVDVPLFGAHNMQNIMGALMVCRELGISEEDFYRHIGSFRGAARRQQLLAAANGSEVYLDFAHAPSKVVSTVKAFREKAGQRPLVACLELHTFSSLNADFLPQYRGSMDAADRALVYFDPHTVEHKKLPALDEEQVKKAFGRKDLTVVTSAEEVSAFLLSNKKQNSIFLLMSSGHFSGTDLTALAGQLTE